MHGFLLVGGEKMSKTGLNQIFPADLVADFGVDGFRYHFLRDTPFGPDGDFSYEGMVARYNTDLANNLGNLLSRVATVVAKKCDGIGPAPRADSPLAAVAAECYAEAAAAWEAVQPSVALDATWRLIREANAYLEANEPWKLDPGPEVDAVHGRRPRGAAHRGRAGHARPCPTPAPRSGAASASAARRRRSASRPRRPGVATRAGWPSRRATRCSPASPRRS